MRDDLSVSGDLVGGQVGDWLVTGWFTEDDVYRPLAEAFAFSLSEHGAPFHLWAKPALGTWNTRRKPEAVLETMDAHPGKTVILMDVDCIVQGSIAPVAEFAGDVGGICAIARNVAKVRHWLAFETSSRVKAFRPTVLRDRDQDRQLPRRDEAERAVLQTGGWQAARRGAADGGATGAWRTIAQRAERRQSLAGAVLGMGKAPAGGRDRGLLRRTTQLLLAAKSATQLQKYTRRRNRFGATHTARRRRRLCKVGPAPTEFGKLATFDGRQHVDVGLHCFEHSHFGLKEHRQKPSFGSATGVVIAHSPSRCPEHMVGSVSARLPCRRSQVL
jgi:hypothetical protein